MIIVRLWGGLGNQLFQYSFGQYLEIETDKKVKVLSGGERSRQIGRASCRERV